MTSRTAHGASRGPGTFLGSTLAFLLLATQFLSCSAAYVPVCLVHEPTRFRALARVALAPIAINTFDLHAGVVADTNAAPVRLLRAELSRLFDLVPLDSSYAGLAAAPVPTGTEGWRAAVTSTGAEAVLFPSYRYVTTRFYLLVEVRLRFHDARDGTLLAESAEETVWQDFAWGGGEDDLAVPLAKTLKLATARLAIHHRPPAPDPPTTPSRRSP